MKVSRPSLKTDQPRPSSYAAMRSPTSSESSQPESHSELRALMSPGEDDVLPIWKGVGVEVVLSLIRLTLTDGRSVGVNEV